jgi:NADH-quinone oxidoreductase subunit N
MAASAFEAAQQTVLILLPELILLLTAMSMMTAAAFVRLPRRQWCRIGVWALLAALTALLAVARQETDMYASVALNDELSFWARMILILTALVVMGLVHDEPADDRAGEFFGSLLMINAGAMLVAAANEVVFLFVGLELVSIPTYLLLYLSKRNPSTREAATKYFFLSIFASGLFLYGLAFLYGATGISNLKAATFLMEKLPLNLSASDTAARVQLGLIAIVFLTAGLCFRVTAVPLHFYAPDVYQGSPVSIAAVLAWVPKAVGFLAMIRVLTAVFSPSPELVQKAIILSWIIAAASMTLGNFVALLQQDLKRLLAYSSIAHAGYLMIGVTVAFANGQHATSLYRGTEGILFYLVAYALMTLGTFGVILALRFQDRPVETVDDLAGVGWSQPWLGIGLSVCLLSLSGIPPLLGFWAKFQIFTAVLAAESMGESRAFVMLAIIGVLTAAVGAFYYLRIVVLMYLSPARQPVQLRGGWPVAVSVGACASLTVLLGLFWTPVAATARAAARAAVAHPAPAPPVPQITAISTAPTRAHESIASGAREVPGGRGSVRAALGMGSPGGSPSPNRAR